MQSKAYNRSLITAPLTRSLSMLFLHFTIITSKQVTYCSPAGSYIDWKNRIKIGKHLVIHTTFIDFGKIWQNIDRPVVVYSSVVLLVVSRFNINFFNFAENVELNNELLKLWKLKWQKREKFSLIRFTRISFSWQAFFLPWFLMQLKFGVSNWKENERLLYSMISFFLRILVLIPFYGVKTWIRIVIRIISWEFSYRWTLWDFLQCH